MAFFDAWYCRYMQIPCSTHLLRVKPAAVLGCLGVILLGTSWMSIKGVPDVSCAVHLWRESSIGWCPIRSWVPHGRSHMALSETRVPKNIPKHHVLVYQCSTPIIVLPAKNCCLGVSLSLSLNPNDLVSSLSHVQWYQYPRKMLGLDLYTCYVDKTPFYVPLVWGYIKLYHIPTRLLSSISPLYSLRLGNFMPSHLVKSPFPAAGCLRRRLNGLLHGTSRLSHTSCHIPGGKNRTGWNALEVASAITGCF